MKIIKATILIAALASAVSSAPAFADRGRGHNFRGHHHARSHHFHRHDHSRIGVFIGAPLLLSPWYATPSYYYPPAVVVPSAPTGYIERSPAAQSSDGGRYWYYCRESETYYPYVNECAGAWEKVVPYAAPS